MSNILYGVGRTVLAGAYGFGSAAMTVASASIPATIGAVAAGACGGIPSALTAIGHTAFLKMEEKGIIAPGRAKTLTTVTSFALAAITFAALLALGVTTPLGAMFIAMPIIGVGAFLNMFGPNEKSVKEKLEECFKLLVNDDEVEKANKNKLYECLNNVVKDVGDINCELDGYVHELEGKKTAIKLLIKLLPSGQTDAEKLKDRCQSCVDSLGTQINLIKENKGLLDETTVGISEDKVAVIVDHAKAIEELIGQTTQTVEEFRADFQQSLKKLEPVQAQ